MSMDSDDNGNNPAFPQIPGASPGLSKREYMATDILKGMLANSEVNIGIEGFKEKIAEAAVLYANALLKELNKW
jgi:hypothetical protein